MTQVLRVAMICTVCSLQLAAADADRVMCGFWPPENELAGLEVADRKLLAFCQGAVLQNRGLTCTPFAGNSDDWILKKLLPDAAFQKAFAEYRPTVDYAENASLDEIDKTRPSKPKSDIMLLQRDSRPALLKRLTPADIQKLPAVYVRLEGLMSLSRPEFAKLFDDRNSQTKIRELAEKFNLERASPLHRGLFTGPVDDFEVSFYHVQLRCLSAELDWKIVRLMTPAEKDRLVNFLVESRALNAVVHAPPIR